MINSKELLKYTNGLTLLFAEDHEELRVNTTEILKNFFLKVDSASDGQEAFDLYEKEGGYDVVLTDILMPKMNGVELIKKIYEINKRQSIVVLSAHDQAEYLLELVNLGIDQFIKKPINYQELLKVLRNIAKEQSSLETKITTPLVILGKDCTFNKNTKILLQNNKNIYITKFEIIFLDLLSNDFGKIYSNEEIVEVYTSLNEVIDSQNIRKLVSKLRKKIPKDTLESIYGVGYRLTPSL